MEEDSERISQPPSRRPKDESIDSDTRIGKLLSLVLRHDPAHLGLSLRHGGWVGIDDVLRAFVDRDILVDRMDLERIVRSDAKQRFRIFNDQIRANQGHSVVVDLGLKSACPPTVLFHGTASRFLESIFQFGILPRSRQFVHLSTDPQQALSIGTRHGGPVVLRVAADHMAMDGIEFQMSENRVWLVAWVPPKYLVC
jgi:putative RNA 2'-phosphotransferase